MTTPSACFEIQLRDFIGSANSNPDPTFWEAFEFVVFGVGVSGCWELETTDGGVEPRKEAEDEGDEGDDRADEPIERDADEEQCLED